MYTNLVHKTLAGPISASEFHKYLLIPDNKVQMKTNQQFLNPVTFNQEKCYL